MVHAFWHIVLELHQFDVTWACLSLPCANDEGQTPRLDGQSTHPSPTAEITWLGLARRCITTVGESSKVERRKILVLFFEQTRMFSKFANLGLPG